MFHPLFFCVSSLPFAWELISLLRESIIKFRLIAGETRNKKKKSSSLSNFQIFQLWFWGGRSKRRLWISIAPPKETDEESDADAVKGQENNGIL